MAYTSYSKILTTSRQIKAAEKHQARAKRGRAKLPIWDKSLCDIPLDEPVGTQAVWYGDHSPGGYISREQKEYWGKNITVSKINPKDPLYKETQPGTGKAPGWLMTVIDY